MVRAIHQNKVLGAVIISDMIEMMDVLPRDKRPAKDAGHDQNVFQNPTTLARVRMRRLTHQHIAISGDLASGFLVAATLWPSHKCNPII